MQLKNTGTKLFWAKKYAVLSWEWTGVIVCIGGCHGVPSVQELSDKIICFVNDGSVTMYDL